MVEIRFGDSREEAGLAGNSVAEARQQFRNEFGIPDKAVARLNGKKVDVKAEAKTHLTDSDKLSFVRTSWKGAILLGALLLALAVTGAAFAYGYITASTSLSVTASGSDFAAITANTSNLPSWTARGHFKGSITGPKPIFDVDTQTSAYTGDLVVSVSIANGDQLVSVYRVLAMKIDVIDSNGAAVDINGDGSVTGADYALLTLGNGSVDLFLGGAADVYTVRVNSGYYVSHIWDGGWTSGYESPLLFAEVAQR